MSEDEQASMRGDMLRRLVSARLLALEAKRLGLDKTTAFKRDMQDFRLGLLYRDYMEKLRSRIAIPPNTLADMKAAFQGMTGTGWQPQNPLTCPPNFKR